MCENFVLFAQVIKEYQLDVTKEVQQFDYYPFKKYVEYIFSPGCLSMMSRSVLYSDWLPGPLQVLFLLEIV